MPSKQPIKPLTMRQQLASKPVRRPDVTCTATDNGARLSIPVEPSKWTRWLLRVRWSATKKIDLDELGAFVWQQCDGHTSVRRISRRLRNEYHVSDREAQLSTMAFLQMLAKKGLIAVKVPQRRGRFSDPENVDPPQGR